jgi:hypothetical protein
MVSSAPGQVERHAVLVATSHRLTLVASCSKLVTAIAMTRTLAAHNLPASTKITGYLPTYWAKGPNIDKITFAELRACVGSRAWALVGWDEAVETMRRPAVPALSSKLTSLDYGTRCYPTGSIVLLMAFAATATLILSATPSAQVPAAFR